MRLFLKWKVGGCFAREVVIILYSMSSLTACVVSEWWSCLVVMKGLGCAVMALFVELFRTVYCCLDEWGVEW